MKCDSCGNELAGGTIICRACNYNNALSNMSAPYSRRSDDAHHRRTTAPLTELPKIIPRKDGDANLIHFPTAQNKPPAVLGSPDDVEPKNDDSQSSDYPPWREHLKEKVRQMRERRLASAPEALTDAFDEPDEDIESDQNPLVESALKRIRWAEHKPAITTTISAGKQGARAAAVARLTQSDPEAEPRPRADQRHQIRPDARIIAPKTNESANDAGVDADDAQGANTANRPPVSRVETRTLTPKMHPPAMPKIPPQPETAAEPKILRPRSRPRAGGDTNVDPKYVQRDPAYTSVIPDKQVETTVIEIALAPEPMPLPEAEPASLWVRTLAGACDFEVVATAFIPLFGAYATLNTSLGVESFFIMLVLLTAITFVYQSVMLLVAGRTFGMALLNLHLLNTEDESLHVTRRQRMLRAWAATFSFLFPPVNFLITQLNDFQRSLPDLVSGTTVSRR
jgi:uncharacterized RDD family membrane protein YckC